MLARPLSPSAVPRAAAARATATSPSGCTACTPVGDSSTGRSIANAHHRGRQIARAPARPRRAARSPSSANAATLSRSVWPRSAPAMIALKTDGGQRSLGPPLGLGDRLEPGRIRRATRYTPARPRARASDRPTASAATPRSAVSPWPNTHSGIRPGERQPREELRRHAAAAAGVVHAARPARAGRLRLAQREEQIRLAPHVREALLAHVPRQERLVDRERARVHVADRVDQAHDPPRAAQVQARQRLPEGARGGRTSRRSAPRRRAPAASRRPRAAAPRSDAARPTRPRRAPTAAAASAAASRRSDRRAP